MGVGEEQKALLPTGPIHLRNLVPSPLQSVGMWAPGTYRVIRATQQAGRGLREGPAEAAASAVSSLPSSRGQGREAGLWGPFIVCPLPPFWQTQAQLQPTAGSWLKLGPAPPTQARPGLHVLPWASSHYGAACCTGHCGCWSPGGTAWAPGKSLPCEPGPGGLILGLSGAQYTRVGQTEKKKAEERGSTGHGAGAR